MVYKVSSRTDSGNAVVNVDGRLAAEALGYGSFGFDNPAAVLLLKEERPEKHLIEIRMAPQDMEKEFSILAFGYCSDAG